jgi:hypothetical protein
MESFAPLLVSGRAAAADWVSSLPVRRSARVAVAVRAREAAARHAGEATVRGGCVRSVLAALGPFQRRGQLMLAEHGIGVVDAEEWYPLAAYAAALETIRDTLGPNTLLQVGRQISRHVPLPPACGSLREALEAMAHCFEASHRGLEPGCVSVRVTSHRSASVATSAPYPCEFGLGAIEGFVETLLGTRATVKHGPDGCRESGTGSCTYLVTLPID